MARSLAQIEQQIAKLKKQADDIKSKEKEGVIQRIREAISHYGITRQELFGNERTPSRKAGKSSSAAPKGRRAAKRTPSPAKYSDGAGRTWTGHGRKPGWILAGLAEGKTLEDFAIKS